MAYGVKWYSYFSDLRDAGEGNYLVEVLERDYPGASLRVKSADDACTVEIEDISDPFYPIRSIKFSFNWISREDSPFDIEDLYITDDLKYKIRLSKLNASNVAEVLFHGFVVPINAEQPFLPKSYVVSFTGSCGLPLLKDVYYLDSVGAFVEGKHSLIKIIANCLSATEHELPIHTTINLYEQSMSLATSPLGQAIIDADGLRSKKAYNVLFDILSSLRAFIVQSKGAWHIIRVKEQAAYSAMVWKFTSDGDPIGAELRPQAAAFGRMEYEPNVPRVKPIRKTVKQSLAMRNSVVTASISPGIPVNRLANGTFSGPVLGTVSGWNNHIGSIDWQRGGVGMPDDPYRIEFLEHIEFDPKKKKRAFNPFAYLDSGPITLNLGDFNIPSDRRKETKIVLRGAFKSNNALSCTFMLSINETEREFNDYLDDNGDWFYSKKEDRTYNVRAAQSVYEPTVKTYHDIKDLQEFQIESKKITNLLNRPEGAVAVLRLRIFPGIQGPGYNSHSFLSLEDLMLYVVEDSVYEGEHKYRIDTKSKIRNPNPADFSMIIADKIDIVTPEQSRETNRVMTGYMTLPGGALTQAWRGILNGNVDPTDTIVEPIQKKALRETVRLLCGRRQIYQGVFMGHSLLPIHCMYSGYDEPDTPTKFFTITQWKWSPVSMEYSLKLSELNFAALPNEDIFLADDEGGRMYRGNSTGSGSGSGPGQSNAEDIVFDDIPPVYFTVGMQEIKVVDLAQYLMSSHAAYSLTDRELHYTDWVSYVTIDRGDDGTALDLQITALPKAPGTDRVLVEFVGNQGEKHILIVPLRAMPAFKSAYTLRDGTSFANLGSLPGGYELPDHWNVQIGAKGLHSGIFIKITGGGDTGDAVNYQNTVGLYVLVEENELQYYNVFDVIGGVDYPAGLYTLEVAFFRNDGDPDNLVEIKRNIIKFTLYDEEYLGKATFEFWDSAANTLVGAINPDGSSEFKMVDSFDNKVKIVDTEHDKITMALSLDGTEVKRRVVEPDPAVTDAEYFVYNAPEPDQQPGYYELMVELELDGDLVYQRLIAYKVNEKTKQPQGGSLVLVSMVPGTTNYNEMGTLSLAGGLFALPASGWNVLADAPVVEGTRRSHRIFQKRAAGLVNVDTSLYAGRPQYRDYAEAESAPKYLIFDDFSSINIDKIHGDNTSFRVIVTDEVAGVVSQIFQADFSFGTLEDLDDLPIEEPGAQTILPGYAMFAITENNVTILNWRPDGATLETFEPESPDDQSNPASNHARIKLKGVTLGHIQEIPNRTVLGNLSGGSAVPQALPVSGDPDTADPGDLVLYSLIQQILADAIDGTAGYIPKFGGEGIVDSIIREVTGKIGIGVNPTEALHVAGNILATGQVKSSIATGTAPLVVASTTMVANLNVQYLDSHEGPYYLDWNNFTNYKSIIAGGGLIDGGLLDQNRTINMGVPSSIGPSSINSVSADSHTHALTGVYSETEVNDLLDGKENTFSKSDIVQGAGMSITGGSLLNKLIGANDITFALAASGVGAGGYRQVDVDIYGRVISGSNPNTLAGYGLNTTVYTKIEVNNLIASAGYIDGGGTAGYIAKFTDSDTIGNSVIFDSGSEINVASSRAFGVEGGAAMRSYLHVHDYLAVGKSGQHGAIVVHSAPSATADPSCAIDIQSTTRGLGLPYMTKAQRDAIVSPKDGLLIVQSNGVGASIGGLKLRLVGSWVHIPWSLADA
ncbi:hypothetical protein LZD49_26325 [Dyadobacter sp. CY261]|uniref:hypothetical protein n=1 Tax=Dyadobacter sp. CY261 TaxID=2907203 RepID=UPI001F16B55F|nr:hypothetical protein [Dyadobacter sp. CY261]MCF0074026.1 hypothetical protein [Dyadobacter sp. CY261]